MQCALGDVHKPWLQIISHAGKLDVSDVRSSVCESVWHLHGARMPHAQKAIRWKSSRTEKHRALGRLQANRDVGGEPTSCGLGRLAPSGPLRLFDSCMS